MQRPYTHSSLCLGGKFLRCMLPRILLCGDMLLRGRPRCRFLRGFPGLVRFVGIVTLRVKGLGLQSGFGFEALGVGLRA